MQYESKEASPFVNSKNHILRKAQMKEFMLHKVSPVVAHIIALLIGGGIMIIFSLFVE